MALQLDNLLAVRNKAEQQLDVLNDRVTSLSQKIFLASNQSDNLWLLLQLSVTEGVQDMYTHFYNLTKQQVLQKSPEEADVTIHEAGSTRSSTRINTKTDKAAVILTSAFCKFYRAS
ncbi:uncharacterized protein LOC132758383 [Ruditapes philippinarum]|uniref:uncharacterized protein LOC132758383 n=1 Tax=Ruditapes philippinarum TaxID=129788 RepID=UPI00295ADF86|nr:uncharacterized protein LOC132758383 [Ruditapes philippinarum]